MAVSEEAYCRLVLDDPDGQWELDGGVLRSKPALTLAESRLACLAGYLIQSQVDIDQFEVRVNTARVLRSPTHYYIPDMMVIPASLMEQFQDDYESLEAYAAALPLVSEVWSRSTARKDYETKLPFYRQRGDTEIWYLHPIERTLRSWQRQDDGGYTETVYTGGIVRPVALPGVALDLDALFARLGPPKG